MTRLQSLLMRWDEGTLTPEEQAELLALLEDPVARRELVRHWTFSRAVRDALPLAAPAPKKTRYWGPVPATAAALLLLVTGWLLWPRLRPVAVIIETAGVVEVIDAHGRRTEARVGQRLYPGQSVQAADEEGLAVIEYPDTTRVEVHGGGRARFEARRVTCAEGVVRAEVAGQALVLATPQGEVHSQDGHVLISASPDAMRVDMEQGNAELIRPGDATALEIGGGSYTVATGGPEAPVVRALPKMHTRPLRSLDVRTGRALRYGVGDRIEAVGPRWLRFVSPQGRIEAHFLPGRKGENRVAFAGNALVIGGGQQISTIDLDTLAFRDLVTAKGIGPVTASPDGSWVAWVEPKKGALRAHDLHTGKARPAQAIGKGPYALCSTPDAAAVVVASADQLRLFGVRRSQGRTFPSAPPSPRLPTCSDDSLAVVGAGGSVWLWSLHEPGAPRVIEQHARPVTALAFSPDGRRLAVGCAGGQVWLFDVRTGAAVQVIRAGPRAVWALAFHRDNRRLAVGTQNGPLTEWALPSP